MRQVMWCTERIEWAVGVAVADLVHGSQLVPGIPLGSPDQVKHSWLVLVARPYGSLYNMHTFVNSSTNQQRKKALGKYS